MLLDLCNFVLETNGGHLAGPGQAGNLKLPVVTHVTVAHCQWHCPQKPLLLVQNIPCGAGFPVYQDKFCVEAIR